MLVIKGAYVYTGLSDDICKMDVYIAGSKIRDEFDIVDSTGVIDAEGLFVMPGVIDAHSHIGGFGYSMDDQDLNEMTGAATPEMQAIYAIDIKSKAFERALKCGITTSCITPGSGNVIGGVACVIKNSGKNIKSRLLKNPAFLKMAMGGNPKGVYGPRNDCPMTRMGIANVIRHEFIKAISYSEKKKKAEEKGEVFEVDLGLENVLKVLNGEISLKVHSEQFDMITVIRIADEFGVSFTLDHAWGASDYYDDIMDSNCKGVIFGPIGVMLLPGEIGKVDIDSLIELDNRGMECAIMTDGPILDPQIIFYQAGEVVRFGGKPERALRMLTYGPATILGLQDRIGAISSGMDADLIVLTDNPVINPSAKVLYTIVNGKIEYSAI